MQNLLSIEFFLIILISISVFLLGYSFKTMVIKRNSINLLDGSYPTSEEEKKIKDFVTNVEQRLTSLEENKVFLEKEVKKSKKMTQVKEELFLKKIEAIELKLNVSMDESGRIPQLEEVALSIDRKINNTIYNKEGLEKVRKIKSLNKEKELIEKEANVSIDIIDKKIKKIKSSIDDY